MGFIRFNWEILNLHFQEALMLVLFPIVYSLLPEGKSIGLQARMQCLKAGSTKHLAKTWARLHYFKITGKKSKKLESKPFLGLCEKCDYVFHIKYS